MPQWLTQFITETLVDFAVKLLLAVIVIVVGFALVKFFVKFIKQRKFFLNMDINAQSFLSNMISAALKIILVFTAVIILGVPESSVLAVIGSCGLAIGLALQGGLSNIVDIANAIATEMAMDDLVISMDDIKTDCLLSLYEDKYGKDI